MLTYLPLIVEIAIGIIVTIIGFLLKRMIDHIDDKLKLILTNQHKQEVVIAEIKKDVEVTKQITNKSEEEINYLSKKVHELDKGLTIVSEWKKHLDKN